MDGRLETTLPIATSGPSDDQFRTYWEKGFDIMTYKYQCEHPELHLNQPVYYHNVAKKTWAPGNIIGVGPEPRSYTVEDEQTGQPLRRNQQLLRPRIGANKITPPLPEVVEREIASGITTQEIFFSLQDHLCNHLHYYLCKYRHLYMYL